MCGYNLNSSLFKAHGHPYSTLDWKSIFCPISIFHMQPFVLRGWISCQHRILSFYLSPRHSADISWTPNGVREKTCLYLLLLQILPYFYLTWPCCFEQLSCFKFTKLFHPCRSFPRTPTQHDNYCNIFFLIPSTCFISPAATIDPIKSNMNEFRWPLIIFLFDESGLCLPPIRCWEKKSEACSRWSCPLEVSLFPVMEQVGSYSLDWVLGSVQAAAVNEPRCSLLCHAGVFWLAIYVASVFSARVPARNQKGS